METDMKHIELGTISLSSTNKMFRDDDLHIEDLIKSVKEKGVIQPILVRTNGKANHYELVCGERRVKASLACKLKTIPAFIRQLTDEEALDLQITENLQRENVNPMKEATAFQWIIKEKKVTTLHLAEKIGKSIDYVEERIRLTRLHADAQKHVREGTLPLKAALKLASVPEALQQKALTECMAVVEGAQGKIYTFKGLAQLQQWLSYNVFNELAFADFDINDATLCPAAGSCLSCTKRTKNAGGLFDDVAKKDFCLDGACFRQKQLAQYDKVKSEVLLKFPGAEIVYRSRTHTVDAAFKKLQPIINSYEGNEISPAEMTKRLAKKAVSKGGKASLSPGEGRPAPRFAGGEAKVAILFGTDRWNGEDKNKKYVCLSFEKKTSASRGSSTSVSPQQKKKDADAQARQNKLNSLEKELTIAAFIKKGSVKTIPDYLTRLLVGYLFNDVGPVSMYILKALGLDFEATRFANGKHEKRKIKVAEANIAELEDQNFDVDTDGVEKAIAKCRTEQLNAMLLYYYYEATYGEQMRLIEKELKLDLKAISAKAKEQTATWWKEEQKKKVSLSPGEGRGEAKKSIKKLLGK